MSLSEEQPEAVNSIVCFSALLFHFLSFWISLSVDKYLLSNSKLIYEIKMFMRVYIFKLL